MNRYLPKAIRRAPRSTRAALLAAAGVVIPCPGYETGAVSPSKAAVYSPARLHLLFLATLCTYQLCVYVRPAPLTINQRQGQVPLNLLLRFIANIDDPLLDQGFDSAFPGRHARSSAAILAATTRNRLMSAAAYKAGHVGRSGQRILRPQI